MIRHPRPGLVALIHLFTLAVMLLLVPAETAAQGVLTNGANHAGSISSPGEIDEWTFSADLGDSILLSVGEILPAGPDPGFRPWLRLRRPDGVEIGSVAGGLAARISITAPLSGTYTVLLRDQPFGSNPGDRLGDYLLHFIIVPGTPTVPSGDHGGTLQSGANQDGSIHRADLDPWTFLANQNDAIMVRVGEVLDSETDPGFRPWIRLYGPNGALLESTAGSLVASIDLTAPLSGAYTVVVADQPFGSAEGAASGNYLLHLVKVPGTSVVPGGDEGGLLESGANHSGRIGAQGATPTLHRGDLDVWTFDANLGNAILLRIGEVIPGEVDPGFRPWIRLFGPTGDQLGSEAGSLVASISIVAPRTGTYTVVVADQPFGVAEGYNVGDYLLHLVKVPGPSAVPSQDEGGTLQSGANAPGRIGAQAPAAAIMHRGDLDVWTFEAGLGNAILLRIGEVLTSEIDPGFRPWIRLFGPNGAQLESAAGSLVASINVVAPLTGTYTVVVADQPFGVAEGYNVGDYLLHLVKVPGPSVIPSDDEGGALESGANHVGRIGGIGPMPTAHRGDLDVWTFEANLGNAILLRIGETLVSETDPGFRPWIRLFDPTGDEIGSAAGSLVASIGVVAPRTGTYTVVVADQPFGVAEGYAVGDYILHLVRVPGPSIVPPQDEGGPMTNGVSHPGRIGAQGSIPILHRGDLDVWTFSALQNAALTVQIQEILPGEVDPGFRPWIRLYSPTGTSIGSQAGALTASINVNAPATGLYTVVVADQPFGVAEGYAVGDYVLSVHGAVDLLPPTTNVDAYTTAFNTALTVPAPGVLSNDNSNGGGTMTAQLVSGVSSGTLVLNENGSFTFTPIAGFVGNASFTYRAVNSVGPGNTVTVTITVPGLVPTTVPDSSYSTPMGTPLNVSAPGVLGNDLSNGGGAMSTQLVTTTTNGILALAADGSFSYTPATGFHGTDRFTYRAVNSVGAGNVAEVSINVPNVTDPQPPTDLYAASITGNTVTLRFTAPTTGPAPTGYVVTGGLAPREELAAIPTGSTDPIYTFVAPTGSFYVRVHTLAGGRRSEAPNEIRIHVNVPVPPSAPANLTGLANGSSIALAWRNTFAGGAPGNVILDVTGSINASLPLGLTDSFQFAGVPGGSYTFRLRAQNGVGVSPSSNALAMSFPEPGCAGAPLPPSNFLAYRLANTIHVLWDPAATGPAPAAFVLNVGGSFGGSFGTPGRSLSGTVGSGTYHLSVAAENACGRSAATVAQTVVVP